MPGPGLGPSPPHGGYQPPTAGPGVLPPGQAHMGMATTAPPTGPPRPSTAPQHAAKPVVDGTPVPWPCATPTQQKLSSTSSVAEHNRAVQEGVAAPIGEPMAPHEVSHIKGVLSMLLEASSQDNTPASMKKREDIAKRLEELYSKLQAGQIKTAASQKVLQMVKSVENQDNQAAHKMLTELCQMDWDQNKNWLQGVKRLVPPR